MGAISPEALVRFVWREAPVMEHVKDRDPFDDGNVVSDEPAMAPPPD